MAAFLEILAIINDQSKNSIKIKFYGQTLIENNLAAKGRGKQEIWIFYPIDFVDVDKKLKNKAGCWIFQFCLNWWLLIKFKILLNFDLFSQTFISMSLAA